MKSMLKQNRNIFIAFLFGLVFFVGYIGVVKLDTDCYTLDWISRMHLYLLAALLSAIPPLLGKWKFGLSVLAGTSIGLLCAELFGPNPEGAALGYGHNGWIIWLGIFAASIVCGIIFEILGHKRNNA